MTLQNCPFSFICVFFFVYLFVRHRCCHQVLQGLESGLVADGGDLGPRVTVGQGRKLFEVNVLQGFLIGVNFENLKM